MPTRRVPDPIASHIGARMRTRRREMNMSLAEFAAASGLSKGHASNLENGLAVMSVYTVYIAGRALRLPPFLLCMRPEDEGLARVLDEILREEDGDVGRAAVRLRALVFGRQGKGKGKGKGKKRKGRTIGRTRRRTPVRPGTIPSPPALVPRGTGEPGRGLSGHARPTGTLCRARTTW